METTTQLVIKKLDGTTIGRRYETWQSFTKDELLKLKDELEKELLKINVLLMEFDKP